MQPFHSVWISTSLEKNLDRLDVPLFCGHMQWKSPVPAKCITQGGRFVKQAHQFIRVVASGFVNGLIFGVVQARSPDSHTLIQNVLQRLYRSRLQRLR